MAEQAVLSFAGPLRQLRAEAGLTQEELAEAAQLSPGSVSDLERGVNHTARRETAMLLAGALGLAWPAVQPAGDKPSGRRAASGLDTEAGPGRPRGHRRPGSAALPAAAVDPASPAGNADWPAPAGQRRRSP